jgi:hypothetical protein
MSWWVCWLLRRRTHPWPHRDGASPRIVEGGPCQGTPTIIAVVVAGAAKAIALAFPLPLDLTLASVVVVGVGGRRGRGRGHLRTWRFLLWLARRQLLLQRVPSI